MKIAFVNQPFDTVVPPGQNSVGYYTYGVACPLAKSCDVLIYGLQDSHSGERAELCRPQPTLRFLPSVRSDIWRYQARTKLGKVMGIKAPLSTSELLFPEYGRQVAMDLQEQQCDIIHIQHCSQYVPLIRAMNPQARIVLQIHAEWFSQSSYQQLARRLEDVDLLLTVSDHITRKCQKDFPAVADRCETMYYGISPAEFDHDKDYGAVARRREKRILYTGAVSPQKGVHVLVDAFRFVVQQYPNVRMDLVGNAANYPIEESFDLKDKAALKGVAPLYAKHPFQRLLVKLSLAAPEAGTYRAYMTRGLPPEVLAKIHFRGHFSLRQDLVEAYYDADVFAFTPVWEEGFGIPPLEAMAAGTPVLGSRSGALPETIREGQTGLLSDKNDSQELARQILRLLKDDDLRQAMGQAARRRSLEFYTWDRIAGQLKGRYEDLCGVQSGMQVSAQ
ncbi:MAG: glycosyltransferase family 4 protein [Acidobacteriaceae bacterium]